jgi:hypothetical protein
MSLGRIYCFESGRADMDKTCRTCANHNKPIDQDPCWSCRPGGYLHSPTGWKESAMLSEMKELQKPFQAHGVKIERS